MWVIKGKLWIAFNITVALGLFFGFGEEISWGQRIFNIIPGDFFMKKNLQQELNIHNLMINDIKINKLIFTYLISLVFGLYFYFSLLAYQKVKIIKIYVDNLGFPIPRVKHIVTFTLFSLLIFTIPDSSKWELWECLFAIMLFLIFIDPYNSAAELIPTTHKVNLKSAFPPPIPEKF
jgi:hypothetical protein